MMWNLPPNTGQGRRITARKHGGKWIANRKRETNGKVTNLKGKIL